MSKYTKDLGLVKAIFEGVNPPLNTAMIWYNTSNNIYKHFYFDRITQNWTELISRPVDVSNKLDKPLSEGDSKDFPFIVGVDKDNNTTRLPSNNIGKNFANTDLNIEKDRTHKGIGNVDLQFPLKFSKLLDKSNDKTFNILPILNRNGDFAKTSNIANAFENALNNVPKEQSLRIAQLLNGGVGDAGAISVYGISPYLIENRTDNVTWISILGANLKLSDVARKLEIIKKSTGEVVATVPNDQIVSDSSQELLFYYNFYKWDLDSYTIRISSGVKTYNSDQDFLVVNQLEYIDTSKITWEWLYNETEASSKDSANGDSLIAEVPDGASGIPKVNVKSSELFKSDEDFIVELQIDQTGYLLPARDNNSHVIGLGYSNKSNSINKNSLVWLSNNITNLNGYNFKFYKSIGISGKNGIYNTYYEDDPFSIKVLFIKTGNLIRTLVNGKNTNTIVNNDSGFSIFTQLVGRDVSFDNKNERRSPKQIVQVKILRAAKLKK